MQQVTVSFDFDDTLDRKDVQEYARDLIKRGYNVIVCTARRETYPTIPGANIDLEIVTEELGIKHVIYCGSEDKYMSFLDETLKNKEFMLPIWHLDDDPDELVMLNKYTDIRGISVFNTTGWRQKCEKLLK